MSTTISQNTCPQITPSTGECLYEAHHAVFSLLVSDDNVYHELAKIAGSEYILLLHNNTNEAKQQLHDPTHKHHNKNVIFNNGGQETHYKFYFGKGDKNIYDPYEYFQIPNTHGNCFAFALYLSSLHSNTPDRHKLLFPEDLININQFMTQKKSINKNNPSEIIMYNQITKQKKDAYKCVIYNDRVIVLHLINIINSKKTLLKKMQVSWNKLSEEKKLEYDIPLDINYTFECFWNTFIQLLHGDGTCSNTYKMTLDSACIWDEEKDYIEPYANAGIATIKDNTTANSQKNYMITNKEIEKFKKGGKILKSIKKTKTRKTRK